MGLFDRLGLPGEDFRVLGREPAETFLPDRLLDRERTDSPELSCFRLRDAEEFLICGVCPVFPDDGEPLLTLRGWGR